MAPKKSRAGLVMGVIIATTLLLCGGGGVAAFVIVSDRTTAGAASGADAAPAQSRKPEPLSAAEYQAILAEVDALVGPAWQKVVAAQRWAATDEAAQGLAQAVTDGGALLAYLTPPVEAAAGHEHLKRAFASFGNDFSGLAPAVERGDVCAGSSAVAQLTNSQSATYVREAVKAFGSAFRFGAWLPEPVAAQARTLANGTYLKKGTLNGSGELKINNSGGDTDVAVSIVPNGTKVAATTVYVAAGKTFTVKRIRDGNYQVYLAFGTDWDTTVAGFTRKCGFERFLDVFDFKTTSRQYTVWEFSLAATSGGGEATTDTVEPGDYPQ